MIVFLLAWVALAVVIVFLGKLIESDLLVAVGAIMTLLTCVFI